MPGLVAVLVEPPIGILGDRGRRRLLVLAGGVCFALSLVLAAASTSFAALLFAFVLFYPSSGAFVSLSQATLMDLDPGAHERNMARWTFAGAVGVFAGPLVLAATGSWRWTFVGLAAGTVVLVVRARGVGFDGRGDGDVRFGDVLRALRRSAVLRWLVLLELQDLGGDVLYGYLALYFVDVVGVSARTAALAVAVWTGADLVGNVIVLRVLGRVSGLRWLRATAVGVLLVLPVVQLAPGPGWKLAGVAALGILHSGWYPISKGRLYSALLGLSGSVMALDTFSGVLGSLLPLALGLVAGAVGLHAAFWLVLLAPLGLLVLVPREP